MSKPSFAVMHNLLEDTFQNMLAAEQKMQTQNEPYFRPSQAPGCCLRMFMDVAEGRDQGYFEETEKFMKDFFTHTGTVTHMVLQKWLGRSGKFLGNWLCGCGNKTELSTKHICKKCGGEMLYEEIEVDIEGIKGHADGLFCFKLNGKKVYVVIDFKGAGLEAINRHKRFGKQFPYKKHVKQISIYSHVFRKYYKLPVVGWALIYTARDNPKTYHIAFHLMKRRDWEKAEETFQAEVKQNRYFKRTLEDLKVGRLLKRKPCEDHEHYEAHIKNDFSPCPYHAMCFSAPKRMRQMLDDAADLLRRVAKRVKRNKTVNDG